MSSNIVLANIVFPEIVLPDDVFQELVFPSMVDAPVSYRPNNPYVLHPKQTDEQRMTWQMYKDIEHQHWVWEDYKPLVNVPTLVDSPHRDDLMEAFHVLDKQLSFFSSRYPPLVLGELCERDTSAEGRAFYGLHVERFAIHLEVFSDLAFQVRGAFAKQDVDLDGQSSPFIVDPFHKINLLAQEFPNLLDSYDIVLRLTAFNYIFYLGSIAVLRALRERTGHAGFDCWLNILTDVESAVHLHWRVVGTANCTALSFLQTAFNIERDATLDCLTGPLRAEVRGYMEEMFNRLPVHNAASALDPVVSPLL